MKTTSHIKPKHLFLSVAMAAAVIGFSVSAEANTAFKVGEHTTLMASTKQPAIYDHTKLDEIFLYAKSVNEDNRVLRLYVDNFIDLKDAVKVIKVLHRGAKGVYINKQRLTYHIQWKVGNSQHDLILQVVK